MEFKWSNERTKFTPPDTHTLQMAQLFALSVSQDNIRLPVKGKLFFLSWLRLWSSCEPWQTASSSQLWHLSLCLSITASSHISKSPTLNISCWDFKKKKLAFLKKKSVTAFKTIDFCIPMNKKPHQAITGLNTQEKVNKSLGKSSCGLKLFERRIHDNC